MRGLHRFIAGTLAAACCIVAGIPRGIAAEEKIQLYKGKDFKSWTVSRWTTAKGDEWCLAEVPNAYSAKMEIRAASGVGIIYFSAEPWDFSGHYDDLSIRIDEGKSIAIKKAAYLKQSVHIIFKDKRMFERIIADMAASSRVTFSSKRSDVGTFFDYEDAAFAFAALENCRTDIGKK